MTIQQVLRSYQGERTQEEYASALGIGQGTLSLIYSGRRGVGMAVLRAFLRAFPEAERDVASALKTQPERVPA